MLVIFFKVQLAPCFEQLRIRIVRARVLPGTNDSTVLRTVATVRAAAPWTPRSIKLTLWVAGQEAQAILHEEVRLLELEAKS